MRVSSLRGMEIVYLLYNYKLVVNTGKAKCTINGNVYIYTQSHTQTLLPRLQDNLLTQGTCHLSSLWQLPISDVG